MPGNIVRSRTTSFDQASGATGQAHPRGRPATGHPHPTPRGALTRTQPAKVGIVNNSEHPTVVVVDFGSTHAQAVARKVRDAHVFSEVVPRNRTVEDVLALDPVSVIVAGNLPEDIESEWVDAAEDVPVFFSREGEGDAAATIDAVVAQAIAGVAPTWTTDAIAAELINQIREQVGKDRVILGLSGGVDSSVVAALIHEAVGDQLTCVFVDHGLLRKGEREQVENDFAKALGIDLVTVDASEQFLTKLKGVTDPEQKRKIIGAEFIRVFEQAQRDLAAQAKGSDAEVKFLAQGTIYPDIIESGIGEGVSNIKSHHNVGGLPDDLQFELVEPLRTLFKDEIRALGRAVGVPEASVSRQPFPGPGLGVRVVGALDKERLDILRDADYIVREELTNSGMDEFVWQCPVVLLADVRSVGVTDEQRTYGHPIVLRPVWTEDAMTADWVRIPFDILARISDRITAEVPQINRVVLDVTPKPPGTIEWE